MTVYFQHKKRAKLLTSFYLLAHIMGKKIYAERQCDVLRCTHHEGENYDTSNMNTWHPAQIIHVPNKCASYFPTSKSLHLGVTNSNQAETRVKLF